MILGLNSAAALSWLGALGGLASTLYLLVVFRDRWHPVRRVQSWCRAVRAVAARRRRTRAAVGRRQLIDDVVNRSKILRKPVPIEVSREPHCHIAKYSDGSISRFFADVPAYKKALANGDASPTRSFVRTPPTPVQNWTAGDLQAWLASNPHPTPPA